MARIVIEDLPAIEALTSEEMAAIFGAGPRARLGVEGLEGRDLMATALAASLYGGTLRIEGTEGADTIRVRQMNNQIAVDGVQIATTSGLMNRVEAGQVTRLDIVPLNGTDLIDVGSGAVAGQQSLLVPALIQSGQGAKQVTFNDTPNHALTASVANAMPAAAILPTASGQMEITLSASGQLIGATSTGTSALLTGVAQVAVGKDVSGRDVLFARTADKSVYVYGPGGTATRVLGGVEQIATGKDVSERDVLFARFTDGTLAMYGRGITWTGIDYMVTGLSIDAAQRAQVTHTPIGQKWADLGGAAGPLGQPTTYEADAPGASGLRVVRFQNGDVYWSAAAGAQALMGGIRDKYNALGGAAGSLGKVTAGEVDAPGAAGVRVARFQNGDVYWSAAGAHAPTGSVQQVAAGKDVSGRDVLFARTADGALTTYGAAGKDVILTGVQQIATGKDVSGRDVLFARFTDGALAMYGAGVSWSSTGTNSRVEQIATGKDVSGRDVLFARFTDGALAMYGAGVSWSSTGTNSRVEQIATGKDVSGRDVLFARFTDGALAMYGAGVNWTNLLVGIQQIATGKDVSDRNTLFALSRDGTVAMYGPGTTWTNVDWLVSEISVDTAFRLQVTYTPIGQKWYALGGATGSLGRLNSVESAVQGIETARVAHFQNGDIYWSAATGTQVITGTVLAAYNAEGGATGALGLPTRVESDQFLGRIFFFEHGAAFGTPNGSKSVTTHNIQAFSEFRANLSAWVAQTTSAFDAMPALQQAAIRERFTADTTNGLSLWGVDEVKRFVNGAIDKVEGLAGGIWETVKQIAVGFLAGTAEAFGAFVGHLEQSMSAFGNGDVLSGFRNLIGSVGMLVRDEVAVVGSVVVNAVNDVVCGVFGGLCFGRALTQGEKDFAHDVFGDQINLTYTRVVNFAYTGMVAANVIYVQSMDLSVPENRSRFVHELTHVFQDQNLSGIDTVSATRDDMNHWFGSGRNSYKIDLNVTTHWFTLTAEAQAQLVENYQLYRDIGYFRQKNAAGVLFDVISAANIGQYERILREAELFGFSWRR